MATPHLQLDALLTLDGVAEAAAEAGEAIAAVHRHRVNLRQWEVTSTESVLRGARCVAALSGGSATLPEQLDPVADRPLAGALRVADLLATSRRAPLTAVLSRAPLQLLAKLHTAASKGDPDLTTAGVPVSADAARRLQDISGMLQGNRTIPGAVMYAVVVGELLALEPFSSDNLAVACAMGRLVAMGRGLDPHGLAVPEVYFYRHQTEFRETIGAVRSGAAGATAQWLRFACAALVAGAAEAQSIADTLAG